MGYDFKFKGRTVGRVVEKVDEDMYVTQRDEETYMKKYNGFGVNRDILKKLEREDVDVVKIVFQNGNGTEKVFEAEISTWFQKGVEDQFGHGTQLFLSEKDFDAVKG